MPLDTLDFDLETAPISVLHATLIVQDLDKLTRFYRDIIGLTVVSTEGNRATLGAAKPFLTLCEEPKARLADPSDPGLFHIAFLLPDRESLASWLAHTIAAGVAPHGASDHNVSEAIYLNDPEGNGIEVYVDRPTSRWNDANGTLYMPSLRLDLSGLPEPTTWAGVPPQTRIGHVHLKTTDIAAAEHFWTARGFDVSARYPGGSFFGAGGYHHQLAANVWQSAGRSAPEGTVTGLQSLVFFSEREQLPDTSPSGIQIIFNPKGA